MEAEFFSQPRIWKDGNCFDYTKVKVVANCSGVNSCILTDSTSGERAALGKNSSRFFEIVANQPTVTSLTVEIKNPFYHWRYDQAQWKSFCLLLTKSMPNLKSVEIQRFYQPLDDFDWPMSILFGALKKPKITHLSMLSQGIERLDAPSFSCSDFEQIGKFKNLRSLSLEGTSQPGGLDAESWVALGKTVNGLKKLEAVKLPLKALLYSQDHADNSVDQVIAAVRAHKNLQKHGVVKTSRNHGMLCN